MLVKTDKDHYGNLILKFIPRLNSTRRGDLAAMAIMRKHNYEPWPNIGWIGKETAAAPAMVANICKLINADVPDMNYAAPTFKHRSKAA